MNEAAVLLKEAPSEESLSEELKIRLKPSQRKALIRVARKLGHSESSMARHAIVERCIAEGEQPATPEGK